MTNIEHLVENAIHCVEDHKSFEEFSECEYNKRMLKEVDVSAKELWCIAMYAVYTYKPGIITNAELRIAGCYGYPIPEE